MVSQDFKYINLTMLFTLVVYVVILAIFLFIRRKEVQRRRIDRDINNNYQEDEDYDENSIFSIPLTTNFDDVGTSCWGRRSAVILFFTRVISFLYMLIVPVIILSTNDSTSFQYFSNWNSLMVCGMFFCASLSSAITLFSSEARRGWSRNVRKLGTATHLSYEVAGGTACFVLVLQYAYLDTGFSLADSPPLASVIMILVEMALNNLTVRFDQYPANMAWLIVYLIVLWPVVFSGTIRDWPYRVMRTDSMSCFTNYFALFLWNFCFYCIFYLLYKLKMFIKLLYLRVTYSSRGSDMDENESERASYVHDTSRFDDVDGDDYSDAGSQSSVSRSESTVDNAGHYAASRNNVNARNALLQDDADFYNTGAGLSRAASTRVNIGRGATAGAGARGAAAAAAADDSTDGSSVASSSVGQRRTSTSNALPRPPGTASSAGAGGAGGGASSRRQSFFEKRRNATAAVNSSSSNTNTQQFDSSTPLEGEPSASAASATTGMTSNPIAYTDNQPTANAPAPAAAAAAVAEEEQQLNGFAFSMGGGGVDEEDIYDDLY